MKKIILGVATLLLGTMAYAQVTTTPLNGDVVPTSKLVAPLPGAALGANTGLSVQNGTANKIRVRQAGTAQSVYSVQNNGFGIGHNLARVTQTGFVQPGSGVENATDVIQSGSFNQSTTIQEGDFNNAVTRQGQKNPFSAGNKALIRQGIANQAEDNFAVIDQDGFGNLAQTKQIYDNSDAWIIQEGEENKSMIVQNSGPNQSDGHEALVEQYGDRNEASVNQDSDPGAQARNMARAVQEGNDNKSKQIQTTNAASGNPGNSALVNQGSAVFTPFTGIYRGMLEGVDPDITLGGWNPLSFGAIAFQIQSGKEHEAEIHQFGGFGVDDNYAEQNQEGVGHDAFIMQNAYGYGGFGDNYAKQVQKGHGNEAAIGQNGWKNKALQTQFGHDNGAFSTQRGVGNKVNTHQRGHANKVTTAQYGFGNAALVVQKHGQSYSVKQGLIPGMMGYGNQADILQLGPDGNFYTDGIDCYFDDPLDPWMDYSIPSFYLPDVCDGCN